MVSAAPRPHHHRHRRERGSPRAPGARSSYAHRVIDTHCHLTFPDFQPDRSPGGVPGVLARAAAQGVDGCITICTTTQDAPNVLAMARAHPRVWCSAGVHPLYASEGPHQWEIMRHVGTDPLCVAWGELGLDNHYKEPAGDVQRAVLEDQLAHIEAWQREGLIKPVVVHCREAFDDLIPILAASSLAPERFVFHCFTGDEHDMRKVLDFGACASFTGVATYRNAAGVQRAAKIIPDDRVMIETDAPFLSPDPHRGTRPCEPWMANVTARHIAHLRGRPWDEFHQQINENTRRFFGVA